MQMDHPEAAPRGTLRLREAAIISGGLLTQQVTVFLTNVVIGRELGANGLGELAILKSLAAFLLILTPLGLDLALLKHASRYADRGAEFRTFTLALRLIVAALNALLLLGVVLWFGDMLQGVYPDIRGFAWLCVLTMIGVGFAADVQIAGALYRAAERPVPYFLIVNSAQFTARMLVTFAILAGGAVWRPSFSARPWSPSRRRSCWNGRRGGGWRAVRPRIGARCGGRWAASWASPSGWRCCCCSTRRCASWTCWC